MHSIPYSILHKVLRTWTQYNPKPSIPVQGVFGQVFEYLAFQRGENRVKVSQALVDVSTLPKQACFFSAFAWTVSAANIQYHELASGIINIDAFRKCPHEEFLSPFCSRVLFGETRIMLLGWAILDMFNEEEKVQGGRAYYTILYKPQGGNRLETLNTICGACDIGND